MAPPELGTTPDGSNSNDMTAPADTQRIVGPALLFVTGAAALVFESAAIRLLSAFCGGTVEAIAIGVAVFVVALAAGSETFGRVAARTARPAHGFAVLVVVAALAVGVSPWLAQACDALGWVPAIDASTAARVTMASLFAIVVMGPAAFLLGGTVPMIAAATPGLLAVGWLAAANAAGAVLGALGFGFVLFERFGLTISLVLAAVALVIAGGVAVALRFPIATEAPTSEGPARSRVPWSAAALAWVGGFATLAFEVIAFRMFAQFVPASVPLLALLLALFVLGLAAGNAAGTWSTKDAARATRSAAAWLPWLAPAILLVPLAAALHDRTAEILGVVRAAWITPLTLSVLPAAFVSGGMFGALLACSGHGATRAAGAGRLLAVNSIGNVLGSVGATFLIVPQVGLRWACLAVAALPAVIGLIAALGARSVVRVVAALAACAGAAGLAVVDPRLTPELPAFPLVLAHVDAPEATVTVVGPRLTGRPALILDRWRMQGGGDLARRTERRQALIPLVLAGDVQSALVLGVGTGASAQALLDGGVDSVVGVELVRGVLDAQPLFDDGRGSLVHRSGCSLIEGDAVAYVRRSTRAFDLILGELYFPDAPGSGSLYSHEHFAAVRARLSDDGVFMQWVPLHQMRFGEFGLIARTFADVFPTTLMFLADADVDQPVVGLFGMNAPHRWSEAELAASMASPRLRGILEDVELATPADLFSAFRGDRYTIEAQFTIPDDDRGNAERNTIDRPLVELRTARKSDGETRLAQANWRLVRDRLADTFDAYLTFETPELAPSPNTASTAKEPPLPERLREMRATWTATNWVLQAQIARIEVKLRRTAGNADPREAERAEIESYLFGLKYDPHHVLINRRVNEVSARCARDRRIEDMATLNENVLTINPANTTAARDLALAHLLLGRFDRVERVVTAAIGTRTDAAFESRLLAVAQYLLGNADAARASLERARTSTGAGFVLADAVGAELAGDRARALELVTAAERSPDLAELARRVRETLK